MSSLLKNQKSRDFLAQNFARLSAEGRKNLKGFLQNLVLLQNSLSGAKPRPKPPLGNPVEDTEEVQK
jgi:hypothetical protein